MCIQISSARNFTHVVMCNIYLHARLTAKQLWLFATSAVLSEIQEKNRHHSLSFVLSRAHQNVAYVQGYTQYLTQSSVTMEVKVCQPHLIISVNMCTLFRSNLQLLRMSRALKSYIY